MSSSDNIIMKKRISFKRFRLSYLIYILIIYLTEKKIALNPLWNKGKVRIAKWHIFQGQVTHFSNWSDTFFKHIFWMKFVSLKEWSHTFFKVFFLWSLCDSYFIIIDIFSIVGFFVCFVLVAFPLILSFVFWLLFSFSVIYSSSLTILSFEV